MTLRLAFLLLLLRVTHKQMEALECVCLLHIFRLVLQKDEIESTTRRSKAKCRAAAGMKTN